MKEKLKLTRSKRDKNVWACSNIFSIDFLLFLHSLGLCCAQPQRWRRRGCGRGERKWHNQRRQKNTVIIMIEKKQCERHLSDSVAFRCCLNLSFTWQYMWTPSGSYESGIKMKLCLTFLQSSLNRRSPISICLVMFKETWMFLKTDERLLQTQSTKTPAQVAFCAQQKAAHWKCASLIQRRRSR